MDWDDLKPKKPKAIEIGQPLAGHSVAELKTLMAALETEIARVRGELGAKEATQAAAQSLFKR